MDAGGGDMMPLRPPPFLRLYEGVDVPPPTHGDIAAAALAPAAVGAAAGPLLPPLRPDEMARRQGMSDTATYCVFGEFHPIIPQFVTNLKHTHIPQLYAEAAFQVQPPGADDAGSSAPKPTAKSELKRLALEVRKNVVNLAQAVAEGRTQDICVLVDHKRVLFVNICNILGRMREYEAWHTIVEVAKEC